MLSNTHFGLICVQRNVGKPCVVHALLLVLQFSSSTLLDIAIADVTTGWKGSLYQMMHGISFCLWLYHMDSPHRMSRLGLVFLYEQFSMSSQLIVWVAQWAWLGILKLGGGKGFLTLMTWRCTIEHKWYHKCGDSIIAQHVHDVIKTNIDPYLDELQKSLEEQRGVKVALSTIWRGLRRSGYTMKKVHIPAQFSDWLLTWFR